MGREEGNGLRTAEGSLKGIPTSHGRGREKEAPVRLRRTSLRDGREARRVTARGWLRKNRNTVFDKHHQGARGNG